MTYYLAKASSNNAFISELKALTVIKSLRVEQTMRKVDRGDFCRDINDAYQDNANSIGHGQTISAPHMHAMCLELLEHNVVKPGAKVMDVGSGSGYLSACFGEMVGKDGKVIGIDVVPNLVDWAKENIKKHHADLISSGKVTIKLGDGWKGDPDNGPFDAIHVGAAAEKIPQSLISQLAKGGKMVIPVGTTSQELLEITKDENGTLHQRMICGVRYVPLVKSSTQ